MASKIQKSIMKKLSKFYSMISSLLTAKVKSLKK